MVSQVANEQDPTRSPSRPGHRWPGAVDPRPGVGQLGQARGHGRRCSPRPAFRVAVNCANSWWRRRMVKRRAIAGTRRIFTPFRTREPN